MSDRETSVPVRRGLFVLRYVQAGHSVEAPKAFVRPAIESREYIEVISAPGDQPGALLTPGGGVVVRAEQPGELRIVVQSVGGRDVDAEFRLETLSAGQAFAGTSSRAPERNEGARSARRDQHPRLEIVGHVSRRGDVRSADGQWLAGPDAPAPIEGVAFNLADYPGLGIEYQVLIGGPGGSWTSWSSGNYSGTRGKFQSLHGIRLRLVGSEAATFVLDVEALFLGSTVASRKGNEVELISPAGVDPLVGLKVALLTRQTRAQAAYDAEVRTHGSRSESGSGRVRVFRAASTRS